MKIKVKVKVLKPECAPYIIDKGDWIDLRAAASMEFSDPQALVLKDGYRDVKFVQHNIPLGVAIELPAGFEAVMLPRSSTPKNYGIICANSQGVIDNTYCGNEDEWHFPAIPFKKGFIAVGDRICQFRIQLSQKATMWQKLKWLLSSGVKLVYTDNLSSKNRGGFGTTGVK